MTYTEEEYNDIIKQTAIGIIEGALSSGNYSDTCAILINRAYDTLEPVFIGKNVFGDIIDVIQDLEQNGMILRIDSMIDTMHVEMITKDDE